MRSSHARWAALVTGAALVLAGCSSGTSTPAVGKEGGGGGYVSLIFANAYSHLGYVPAVNRFVEKAEQVSNGHLKIVVQNEWSGDSPDYEQTVVRDVASGKAALGWSGTRVLDTLGVTSARALTAPMLLDGYGLEDAVMRSDIPGRVLAGLGPAGVTGLAVLAGGLRKPWAVTAPLLGPATWQGKTFAAFPSDGAAAAIRALGATPSTAGFGDALDAGLADGSIDGYEKNLLVVGINGTWAASPYVTTNVTLWPETAVLFANPKKLASLTKLQRSWLTTAAAAASRESAGLMNTDAQTLAELCKHPVHAATATPQDLAALQDAFTRVYAGLEQDAVTRAIIEQIRKLKSSVPPDPPLVTPAGCAA
jgi:TRAP-type transport system periplasmic protein